MPGIDSILCPVDFSERSLAALDMAFDLSVEFSSNLYILHVIKDFVRDATAVHAGVGFGIDAFKDQLHADAIERINVLIKNRTPVRTGVLAAVAHGDPALEIKSECEKREVDLVVLSSRGHSMLGRLVLGSVTERLLGISICPVLVIPYKD
jgi:nucleotide-binding universal stress UspA family protein